MIITIIANGQLSLTITEPQGEVQEAAMRAVQAANSGVTGENELKQTKVSERPVLVTTAHKGVFFGYATETGGATIRLARARLCVYWTADLRGFMGLASHGPTSNCKIGPAADIELRDVTSVSEVSPEAVARWEKSPWA